MTANHGITPLEYKVLVRPVEESGTIELAGGHTLYKPDSLTERDQHAAMEGEIVAISPFAFSYEEWPDGAERPKEGQKIVFARYSGITVKGDDEVEYRLMNDKDVVALRGVS